MLSGVNKNLLVPFSAGTNNNNGKTYIYFYVYSATNILNVPFNNSFISLA